MTRGSACRGFAFAGVAALAAACAAAPLPSMRPLSHQSEQDRAWDSRTCAWAAEDASGYWVDLSPGENAIMEGFTYGADRESPAGDPAAVAPPEARGPAAPSPAHLGRGGRRQFEAVYEQCMRAHGYEPSSPTGEEEGPR